MKKCPKCFCEKDRKEGFYKNRASYDKLSTYCKICTLQMNRAHPNRLEHKRRYYEKHKQECLRAALSWKKANPDARKKIQARWYRNNASAVMMMNRKRIYRIMDEATPAWANKFFMEEAYSLARLRTKVLGDKWVVDHIVPLLHDKVCGLHSHTNLRVIQNKVNAAKSNRFWPDMP